MKSKAKKKRLTTLEKNRIQWEKEEAWMDAILLAYDKNIKYDYPMPDAYKIIKSCKQVIRDIKVSKPFKDKVEKVLFGTYDSYAPMENYMGHYDSRFGHEWFFGYGTLYRWRDGEREGAKSRVQQYLSTRDRGYFKKLQDAVRITKDIKEFETSKVMEI